MSKTKDAESVNKHLIEILTNYKYNIFHSDNGGENTAKCISETCSKYNVRKCSKFQVKEIHGRPYHPQSKGVVEVFNKTLKEIIEKLLKSGEGEEWTDVLGKALFIYNNNQHSTIKVTPQSVLDLHKDPTTPKATKMNSTPKVQHRNEQKKKF